MLDRDHRLTASAGFSTATRRGRRAGTRTLVLHLHAPVGRDSAGTADPTPPRVGFVVGRSVGNAVRRNRVKRRLRELARERLGALAPGTMLVVRALPAAAGATYSGLAVDFDGALRRLGVSVRTAADSEPDLETQPEASAPGRDETARAVHGR